MVDKTEADSESVVGDECHIVSASPTGPRYDPDYPSSEIDSTENMILLCAVDHKMIDDQQETYTAELVRTIKSNHEKWVETKLRDDPVFPPVRVRRLQENLPERLERMTSGKDLTALVAECCGSYFDHDDDLSDGEIELVGGFFQEIKDWVDMYGDLEPIERIRMAKTVQGLLSDLSSRGFMAFAAREIQQMEGGISSQPSAFPVLHLTVLRANNPQIIHGQHT